MKILVVNCGSSSLKYQLIDMSDESVMAKGLVDRISLDKATLTHEPTGKPKMEFSAEIPNHSVAIKMVFDALLNSEYGVISDLSEINGVGHRYVNGGVEFPESALITEKTIEHFESTFALAPLHNPAHVAGIKACASVMPGVPMVAVFDTSFHTSSMPAKAYTYGLPYEDGKEYNIRRYGAHGTSHKFVAQRTAELVGKPIEELKIITCHLGNGSSITAVDGGKSVDTTMGMTPLAGVLMGTRTGDLDASILIYLMKQGIVKAEDLESYLNKKSGFLGVSGVSSDLRNVEEAAAAGNEQAKISMEVFYYGVQKYIGAYTVAMGGVDVISFTAGIGENSILARERILAGVKCLGVTLDKEANNVRGKATLISTADSKVKAYIVPTNEELAIARDTLNLIK